MSTPASTKAFQHRRPPPSAGSAHFRPSTPRPRGLAALFPIHMGTPRSFAAAGAQAVTLLAMPSSLLRPPAVKQGVLAFELPPGSRLGGRVPATRLVLPPFPRILWRSLRLSRPNRPAGRTPRTWEDTPQRTNAQGVLVQTASAAKQARRLSSVITDADECTHVLRPLPGTASASNGALCAGREGRRQERDRAFTRPPSPMVIKISLSGWGGGSGGPNVGLRARKAADKTGARLRAPPPPPDASPHSQPARVKLGCLLPISHHWDMSWRYFPPFPWDIACAFSSLPFHGDIMA